MGDTGFRERATLVLALACAAAIVAGIVLPILQGHIHALTAALR